MTVWHVMLVLFRPSLGDPSRVTDVRLGPSLLLAQLCVVTVVLEHSRGLVLQGVLDVRLASMRRRGRQHVGLVGLEHISTCQDKPALVIVSCVQLAHSRC